MKRFFDFTISSTLIGLIFPLYIVVAFAIAKKLGSPVLFTQIRPGISGKPFKMIKFRTMLELSDSFGCLLSDSERMTPFGTFLRAASIDELPGLWNVLKGDMSLVGPRPLLMEYLPLYSSNQFRRHEMRPGITGWAQINGRNSIAWEDKFKFDVWYVDNHSFMLDIKILLLTVIKVLKRDGISSDGEATMHRFTGSTGKQL